MSTRATEDGADARYAEPPADTAGTPKRTQRWWAPRDWRVRSRLVALIVIPTAVALLLAGLRVYENIVNTVTHERIETTAAVGQAVVELANQLGRERLYSAAYIADDPNYERRSPDLLRSLQDQIQETKQSQQALDNAVAELGDPGSSLAADRLQTMLNSLDGLDTVREEVQGTRVTVLPTVTKYRQVINALTDFNQTIAENTDDTPLRESVRALTALSKAREQLSYESALMLHSLMRGSMSGGVQEAIDSSRARYDNEIQNFNGSATAEQRQTFDSTFSGVEVSQMATTRLRVMMRARTDQPLTGVTENDNAATYQDVAVTALERMEDVERSMAGAVEGQAADLRSGALTRAIMDSLLVLAVVIAVFIITSLVVRSLVRPLRSLREGAMRIAEEDLPGSIRRMQETSSAPEDVDVVPIPVTSRDEIGEVARSFDEVHRVALRLASDEAALRSNVNAMFVNLSRRSQTLVERQLRLIDGLEQSEQDSDRLSDLFQLDHLATRMRRNNENLLVLSGQDNTRKWAQPVPLVDVLRGAISEVEQYDRVNVRAPSHISVLGRPVNDVIHLVAELVENATSFSSHDTQVSVTAQVLDGGGVRVEVTDSGIGMAPEEIAATNERLAEPPVIDVGVSRRMGLFVVSRLAARHGIQVRLAEAHNGGIVASAVFPPDLLITPVDPAGPPALGAAPATPDTFAEATAAWAANPAPPEPGDVWASGRRGDGDLPKRNPGISRPETEVPGRRADEHPPSGEDLWSTGWNSRPAPAEPPAPPAPPARRAPEPPAAPEPPRAEPPAASPYTTAGHGDPRTGEDRAAPGGRTAEPRPVEETRSWHAPPERPSTDVWGAARPSADDGRQRPADPDPREGYGSTAYLSRRYGGGAGQNTVVPPSPEDSSEALPIFDAIESNWFRRRTGGPVSEPESGPIPRVNGNGAAAPRAARPAPGTHARAEDARPAAPGGVDRGAERGTAPAAPARPARTEDEWRSDADRGWKAARSAAEPIAGGLTSSGLPKRVPKANLVPGTAPQPENVRQIPTRSADRVRNRFAGLQKGIREGRNRAGDQPSEEN
ncbi:sensor histidine kinase [Nocardiopsis trehalosi]|uniref:sensor histidine kinase n=1 Tax=Nocardiopsis trehalosi TaxID=109329 RepID=UPI00082F2368|nr:nitrate- and nitrite sensing domain-containing protein [Nocardiopsis trehalosi]